MTSIPEMDMVGSHDPIFKFLDSQLYLLNGWS